jgi:hypothetical protein
LASTIALFSSGVQSKALLGRGFSDGSGIFMVLCTTLSVVLTVAALLRFFPVWVVLGGGFTWRAGGALEDDVGWRAGGH